MYSLLLSISPSASVQNNASDLLCSVFLFSAALPHSSCVILRQQDGRWQNSKRAVLAAVSLYSRLRGWHSGCIRLIPDKYSLKIPSLPLKVPVLPDAASGCHIAEASHTALDTAFFAFLLLKPLLQKSAVQVQQCAFLIFHVFL